MYQLLFDGTILYDPRGANEIDGLIIRDPDLSVGVGKAGSMSFEIGAEHPALPLLTRMHGILTLRDGGETLFRGRIIRDTRAFEMHRRIEAEGVLACLNDSVVQPFSFPADYEEDAGYQAAAERGEVVKFWLRTLLSRHNAQVGAQQRILPGRVTVPDPEEVPVFENEEYSTTWEIINQTLPETLGGYLNVRYGADATYLDYLSGFAEENPQPVEFARNLLDLEDEVYGGDRYTAILPLGKDGITINPETVWSSGSIVQEGILLVDTAAEEQLGGRITRVVDFPEIDKKPQLRKQAAAVLRKNGMPETITCKACDLHGIEDIRGFRVGQLVRVTSVPHGMTGELYPLMEMKLDILNPGKTEITLGETRQTLTTSILSAGSVKTAISKAEAAQTVAGEARRAAAEADTKAENAQTAAGGATGTAGQAASAAADAVAAVNALAGDVGTLQGDYTALERRVSALEDAQV